MLCHKLSKGMDYGPGVRNLQDRRLRTAEEKLSYHHRQPIQMRIPFGGPLFDALLFGKESLGHPPMEVVDELLRLLLVHAVSFQKVGLLIGRLPPQRRQPQPPDPVHQSTFCDTQPSSHWLGWHLPFSFEPNSAANRLRNWRSLLENLSELRPQ